MKYRNTIIVLVVLALLAGYVYYDQQQSATNAATPTPAPEVKILDLNADDVTGLQVSGPLSRTVAHKDNGAWLMDEPSREEADTARLNNLVAQFAKLKATRALTETPSNLAPFGLVTGTLTLTLQVKDRAEVVRFGDATLGGSSNYAQRVGDPKVYLVSPTLLGDAQRLLTAPPKRPTPTPTAPPTPTPAPTTPAPEGPPAPTTPTPAPTPTETPKP